MRSKIRPVCVEFKLQKNKIIPFTVVQKDQVLRAGEEPEYGYAADIAFLDLYTSEVSQIHIPAISYSELANYDKWTTEFSELKGNVLEWRDSVRPQIESMPSDLSSKASLIKHKFDDAVTEVEDIIADLKRGKNPEDLIQQFNADMGELSSRCSKAKSILDDFYQLLDDHSDLLIKEGDKFVQLSAEITQMTKEQQQQMDDLTKKIQSYESERKAFIAGASVTGVLGTAFLVGGICATILIPGCGFYIGIACFFGAGVSYLGMSICIEKAMELQAAINAAASKQSKIDNEKMTLGLIGAQFDNFASQTNDLTAAVEDIRNNWDGITDALRNIAEYASQISKKAAGSEEEWEDIKNDLTSVSIILTALEEAIETMDIKTNILTQCDLSDCKTQEEFVDKLKKYWEEHAQNQTTA